MSMHSAHSARCERIRLGSRVFCLAGSVRMRSNSHNLFDHLGILLISNSDLFDFRVAQHPGVHCKMFTCHAV